MTILDRQERLGAIFDIWRVRDQITPERSERFPQTFQQRMTPAQYALTRTDLIWFDDTSRSVECGVWIAIFPREYQTAVTSVLYDMEGRYRGLPMDDDRLERFRADAVTLVRYAMLADGAE